MAAIGALILRLTLASVLVAHGVHTLFGTFAGAGAGPGGLATTAAHFTAVGLVPATPLAVIVGVIQLAGGLFIAVGLFTRVASVAVLAYLCLGLWKENAPWGFFLNWTFDPTRGNGIEYSLVLIGALVCLALSGAGEWSADGRRAHSAAARAAGRARARFGSR
jgi:putative oxidoreductase